MWCTSTHIWYKQAFNRVASKMNTRPWMLRARLHQMPDTENSAPPLNQHLTTLAKIRGNTRHGYKPGDVDAMGQKWRTLLGQPFYVATKSHTQKIQHFRNFKHTREKGRQHSSNNDPFEKKHLQNCTRRGSSVPSSVGVPNQKQPNPNITSISKEKTRSAQNNQKNLAKTQSKSQSQKQTTELHHNTTYNRPPHATTQTP